MGESVVKRVLVGAVVALALSVTGLVAAPPAGAGLTGPSTCPASVDTDVEGWVCMLYRLELFRSPSDSEVAFWTGVEEASGPGAVTDGILFSVESTESYVAFLYESQLARPADPAGLQFWAANIRQHRSELPFELGLFTSAEFADQFADTDEYVEFLYGYYFDRASDPGGLAFWSGALQSEALTPEEVVSSFQHAEEAGNLVAELAFADVLNRSPDPSGFAFWSDRGADVGLLKVIAEMAASEEAIATLGAEAQSSAAASAVGSRKG